MALDEWIGNLPMANTAEAARQLERATDELARLDASCELRLELLETLRPTVQYICARLDRSPVAFARAELPDIAQRIQMRLVLGYKTVVRDVSITDEPELDKMTLGLHRALSDQSRILLRSLQRYTAPPAFLWHENHQLYLFADEFGLADATCPDDENHGNQPLSIAEVYLRAALITVARPNQLRQSHLTGVFNALEHWVSLTSITTVCEDALFVVDLDTDNPPRYGELVAGGTDLCGIRTDVLVYELEAYLNEIDTKVEIPDYMEAPLLRHVVLAWDMLKKRSFKRAPSTGPMKVCVGLSAAHYYLSGGVEFVDQIGGTEARLRREINPFLGDDETPARAEKTDDVWDDAFDVGAKIPENPNVEDPQKILLRREAPQDSIPMDCYDTTIVNTSPGGYCIRWSGELPPSLLIGDILGIHETTDSRWCIAVCRWIHQAHPDLLMGIELLAPRAIPVAIRVVKTKRGQQDFARGFLLPELSAINQPAMIITPRLPFQESLKIHIRRQGMQTTAQLMRGVLSTESFNQFTFRMLDGYLENSRNDMNMEQLWELIGDD